MPNREISQIPPIIREIVERFSHVPQVTAIVLGGSRATANDDPQSDWDLYVFADLPVAPDIRREIASHFTSAPEIDNPWFGPEDGWHDEATGIKIDLVYWSPAWLEDQLCRVIRDSVASVGYSTCFWYTIQHAISLYDPFNWFANLQKQADTPYPESLRRAIVELNLPLLRQSQSSFLDQVELARLRQDAVGVQHRITEFLACYFDILFAVNCLPHPGEKRLIAFAEEQCKLLPGGMRDDIRKFLDESTGLDQPFMTETGNMLAAGIEQLASREGLPVDWPR
jgi:predicted nucleotidyltransferase